MGWLTACACVGSAYAYQPYESLEQQRGYDPNRFRKYEQPSTPYNVAPQYNAPAPYYYNDRGNAEQARERCQYLLNEITPLAEYLSDSARQLHRCAEARDLDNACNGAFQQTAQAHSRYQNAVMQIRRLCH